MAKINTNIMNDIAESLKDSTKNLSKEEKEKVENEVLQEAQQKIENKQKQIKEATSKTSEELNNYANKVEETENSIVSSASKLDSANEMPKITSTIDLNARNEKIAIKREERKNNSTSSTSSNTSKTSDTKVTEKNVTSSNTNTKTIETSKKTNDTKVVETNEIVDKSSTYNIKNTNITAKEKFKEQQLEEKNSKSNTNTTISQNLKNVEKRIDDIDTKNSNNINNSKTLTNSEISNRLGYIPGTELAIQEYSKATSKKIKEAKSVSNTNSSTNLEISSRLGYIPGTELAIQEYSKAASKKIKEAKSVSNTSSSTDEVPQQKSVREYLQAGPQWSYSDKSPINGYDVLTGVVSTTEEEPSFWHKLIYGTPESNKILLENAEIIANDNDAVKEEYYNEHGYVTGGDLAVGAISIVEGVGIFAEDIVKVADIALSGAVTAFGALMALVSLPTNKNSWNEFKIFTEDIWDRTASRISKDHVSSALDSFYNNTVTGQGIKQSSAHFETARSFGVGVGYVGGAVLTGGAIGGLAGAAAGATKAALINGAVYGLARFGGSTGDAIQNGASMEEALLYGGLTGLKEAAGMFIGSRINAVTPIKGALPMTKGAWVNSATHVALDTLDGAASALADPLIQTVVQSIYTPSEEKLSEIGYKGTAESYNNLSFGEKYKVNFEANGGVNNVVGTAVFSGVMSAGSEVIGQIADNNAYKKGKELYNETKDIEGKLDEAIKNSDNNTINELMNRQKEIDKTLKKGKVGYYYTLTSLEDNIEKNTLTPELINTFLDNDDVENLFNSLTDEQKMLLADQMSYTQARKFTDKVGDKTKKEFLKQNPEIFTTRSATADIVNEVHYGETMSDVSRHIKDSGLNEKETKKYLDGQEFNDLIHKSITSNDDKDELLFDYIISTIQTNSNSINDSDLLELFKYRAYSDSVIENCGYRLKDIFSNMGDSEMKNFISDATSNSLIELYSCDVISKDIKEEIAQSLISKANELDSLDFARTFATFDNEQLQISLLESDNFKFDYSINRYFDYYVKNTTSPDVKKAFFKKAASLEPVLSSDFMMFEKFTKNLSPSDLQLFEESIYTKDYIRYLNALGDSDSKFISSRTSEVISRFKDSPLDFNNEDGFCLFNSLSTSTQNECINYMKESIDNSVSNSTFKNFINSKEFDIDELFNLYKDGSKINDNNIGVFLKLYKDNPYVLKTLDIDILSPEIIKGGDNFLEMLSIYTDKAKQVVELQKTNPESLVKLTELVKELSVDDSLSTYRRKMYVLLSNTDLLDEIDINKFNVDDAYDYIMTNSRNSVLISQMEQITKPNDIIRLKEYSEGYSKNFDAYLENLYQQATTTDDKKNILMTKMFGISKQESDILLNSYYKNLSLEELENARKYIGDESIDYLINLSTISKIDDEITLDQLFKVASGERQDAIKVVSDMKKVYAQTYLKKLGDTNSSIQKLIGEISTSKSLEDFSFDDFSGGILLKVNGKEIPIIEAPDKFDFLIHSTGAYNPQKLNGGSYFDAWNNSDRTSNNGICCSYITESQIGMASIIDGDAVVYGFSGFSDEALSVMGPTDISSINDKIDTTSYKTPLFITADKLSENSIDYYNELVIYRTELRDTTSNLKNIQPNYVFVFDNSSGKLKENAIKAASAYDPPLPIIYLSKEKVVTEGATKIDTLLDSFKTNHNVNDFEGALKLHESLRTSLGLYENQVSKLPESKITDAISDYLIGIVEQAKNVPENNLLYIEQLEQVKSIIQEEGKKFTSYYEQFMHKTYDIDSSVIRNIDDIISYLRGES